MKLPTWLVLYFQSKLIFLNQAYKLSYIVQTWLVSFAFLMRSPKCSTFCFSFSFNLLTNLSRINFSSQNRKKRMIQKRVKVRKLNNGQRKKTHSTALSFFVWTSTSTNWKCASVITNYLIFIGQTFSRPDFELGRLSFRKFEEIGFETFAARPGLDNLDGKNQMKK